LAACVAVLLGVQNPSAPEFLGVLTPRQEVNLAPLVEGRLVRVLVRIGDHVDQGAVLAEIDASPMQREVDQARARLDEALAARAGATTKLHIAEEALSRVTALAQDEIVAREKVGEAERERELAQSALEMAQARVEQQQTDLARLGDRVRSTRIAAPFPGTVTQRFANPGALVGPQTPIVRLIGSEALWARFAVPLDHSSAVRTGARIRIRVPDLELHTRGTVRQVSSEVDPASGMIFCEASVDPPPQWAGQPLAGQVIRVSLDR
jgi:RND family efflux transporter MFP subunit